MVIGFSVKASRAIQAHASASAVPLHLETVIYRLIDTVRNKVAALLPPVIETRVLGEAVVQQVFTISLKGKETQTIAGCRVGNGVIARDSKIRVLRGEAREVVHEGELDFLLVCTRAKRAAESLSAPRAIGLS
jgi:translation initiation factor IF-2